MTWLPGIERVANPRNSGGAIRQLSAPPRIVLHTTEVPAANMKRLAGRHEWPPHLWGDPHTGELVQTVRLFRSSYALRASSHVETNHMGQCIQIELHLRAADTPHLPDLVLATIGRWVEQIATLAGVPLVAYHPNLGAGAYGVNAPQRMTRHQWATFSGVCTHQHVPDNSHWDCGAIDLHRIVEWAHFWRHYQPPTKRGIFMALTDAEQRELLTLTRRIVQSVEGDDQALAAAGRRPSLRTVVLNTRSQILGALPTDTATSAEVVQIAEDALNELIAALDGLDVDGRPATGQDARELIAELIGAVLPE